MAQTPADPSRRSFLEAGSAAALSLTLPGGKASAQTTGNRTVAPPPSLAGVRGYVMSKIQAGVVPSLVVQVTRQGRPVWAEAFGFADLERRQPTTLDSIYRIASVSKPFTVSALMTLVDQGRIDFDAPANRYLRGAKLRAFRGTPEAMTLRRLANHSSGLPVHEILFYDGAARLSPAETVARYGFAAWTPGRRFDYSNLGTAILGFVSADVTNMSWPDFMRQALFDPLDLRGTFAELPPGRELEAAGAAGEHVTQQYDYDISGRFVHCAGHWTSHPGSSSMWSNAADLTHFAEMHLAGGIDCGRRILSQRAVATMQEFTVPAREPGIIYGNGWITHANLVHRNFNHSGGGPGTGVMLAAYPDDGVVTVVLTNYFGAMASEVTRRLAEAMFGSAPSTAPQQDMGSSAPVTGAWRGTLRHHEGDIPCHLAITGAADAEVRLGRMPPVALSQVSCENGAFLGTTVGILMRGPGFHGDSIIDFILRLEEGRLIGIADTYAKGYFEVAHWVELERAD